MPLKIGTAAPDFTLKCMTEHGLVDVTLSQNFGQYNTVLLFFPFAFTPVCAHEMCDVAGGIHLDVSLNAIVYGISVDSPFAQYAWVKQNEISIKLLSDFNKTVIKAYDLILPTLAGIGDTAARAAVVIDKSGKIIHIEQTPVPKDLPDFDALKTILRTLK